VRSHRTGRVITCRKKDKWGHLKVTLTRKGAQERGEDKKDFSVHRLVLAAFTHASDQEVRHINGIAWDNTLENLTYGTSKENSEDAKRHGTLRGAPKLTPQQVEEIRTTERRGQPPSTTSKLTFEIAEQIRARYADGEGRSELGRIFGVSYVAVDNIVKDRTWTKPVSGDSADELAARYGVVPGTIRDIWAGRRWTAEVREPRASFIAVKIASVHCSGHEQVYGLTVQDHHSHVTGGIVTHNTGRLSSADPNLQNIPRPENDKWRLRNAFIPEPGNEIIAVDYEQLEMRLLAAGAMDRDMLAVFERNWDIHMGNAAMMYGVPYEDLVEAKNVDKQVKAGQLPESAMIDYVLKCITYRSDAKNIGFGLNYGMGPGKLAGRLGISLAEAKKKISMYKDAYPAVTRFYAEAIAETEKTGYAFTVLGRRRNIPEIASHRSDERALGERLAVNTQIQGSAADVCKMAQINIMKLDVEGRYGCRLLLQVHDELVFECPKEHVKDATPEITDIMEHPFTHDLAVHLAVDAGSGASWGLAK
jgi:hypothetical protein